MNSPWIAATSLGLSLALLACDKPKVPIPKESVESEQHKPPRLPSPDETLMMLAIYESVARQAWDAVGDRLIAGEREATFEGEYGQVGFMRAEEDLSKPSHHYLMGGPTKGIVEIIREGSEVQRVILRPGEFGFVTYYTTIQLWEKDTFLDDLEQEAGPFATAQPTTAPESKPEGKDKPQPESKPAPR